MKFVDVVEARGDEKVETNEAEGVNFVFIYRGRRILNLIRVKNVVPDTLKETEDTEVYNPRNCLQSIRIKEYVKL